MIKDRKVCNKCHIDKPGSEFHTKKRYRKDGTPTPYLYSICKACFGLQCAKWNKNNPERRRAIARSYQRKKKFGIDSTAYVDMLLAQNFACAICGTVKQRRLDIDHSHVTKKNRGLLCTSCNNGLGRFQDDPKLLRAAALYLEKYQEKADLLQAFVSDKFPLQKFTAVM